MLKKPTSLMTALIVAGLALTVAPPVESQGLREIIQQRREERQQTQAPQRKQAPTSAPGTVTMTINQGGKQRMFLVHAPQNVRPGAGIVLVWHGGGGNAARTVQTSGMNDLADRYGFIAAYPDSGGQTWNDGRNGTRGNGDDVGFARAIVKTLGQQYGASSGKVFSMGISNGGIMSYKLACDAPDMVRAIAPISANMPEALVRACNPRSGTPVMMFSGTDDPLMPYNGGEPKLAKMIEKFRGPQTDTMTSSPSTAEFWARENGCGSGSSRDLPDRSRDSTSVTQISFGGCRSGDVVLYRVNGGGHAWPGAPGDGSRLTGANTHDINASQTAVNFFQKYGL